MSKKTKTMWTTGGVTIKEEKNYTVTENHYGQVYESILDPLFLIQRACAFYLFQFICNHCNSENEIEISAYFRDKFIKAHTEFNIKNGRGETGYSHSSILKSLIDLKKAGLIIGMGRDRHYKVNPLYFWKSSTELRKKSIEALSISGKI